MPPPQTLASFASSQLALLATELETEVTSTTTLIQGSSPSALQRAGVALTNLTIANLRTGLGGKTVLELGLDSAVKSDGDDLPEHGVRTGDLVAVRVLGAVGKGKKSGGNGKEKGGDGSEDGEKEESKGVVTRVQREKISVALDGEGVPEGRVWIVKLADEVTFKRMNQVMTRMVRMSEGEHSNFLRVMFGLSSVSPAEETANLEWVDESLNDSQKDAIRFALGSREVALIHGPPGTGKTHTLIELILQLLKQKKRILVCGPSNISVDNIVERLSPHKIPLVRLGHPARLLPSVLNHSLDVLTTTSDAAAIVRDIRKEMDAKQASIRKTKSGRERKGIYGELKELRKEFRVREKKVVSELVTGCKVVLATLHGAGGYQLKDEDFDVVIIDEASQALEAQCWVALLNAKKVVLAGDHLQLPPTIKSLNSKTKVKKSEAGKGLTLETTLFDRLLTLYGDGIKRMLTTQYRMHEKIMRFPSDELYDGKLVAYEGVAKRLLRDLPDVQESDDTNESLVFWDTQGGDFPEKTEEEEIGKRKGIHAGESKCNEMEAALVKKQVRDLVEAGVKPEDIAVVTPYNAQLALMSHSLKEKFPGIELGSVDGFQGREKEAVIVSLVRSNADHEVGFLGEKRRLNVAMTRPKRFLAIIGDSETVAKGSHFLKRWMAFLEDEADLRFPDIAMLNDE